MKKLSLLLIGFLTSLQIAFAQIDTLEFYYLSDYYFENVLPYSAYTASFNKNNPNYVYAACRELGVVTFDVSDQTNPVPVDTISVFAFNDFKPTNLSQFENYLMVSTGGYDGFTQNAGLTILDISLPDHPVIQDLWDSTAFNQGAAIAISDGAYAYVGAMDKGVIILDVTDKTLIKYVSSILPDPNFPEVPGFFSMPNARGLYLYEGNKLLVANDAGGFRIIDVSDKLNPVEIEKHINADIDSLAHGAYNNIVVLDHYAFVTVDWCGLEVIDLNTSPLTTLHWFNPWNCDSTNWIGRPGHTNDLKLVGDSLLFVSGADSEVLVFDVTTPSAPKLIGNYAVPFDSIASWSLDVNYPLVAIALINNEILQTPFYSNEGGIALLEWETKSFVHINNEIITNPPSIYPNPVNSILYLNQTNGNTIVQITDCMGRNIIESTYQNGIDCSQLKSGLYYIQTFDLQGKRIGLSGFVKQ
jgi:hypothetical protein